LVLFKGNDPIAKLISKIEMKYVSEQQRKESPILWTHVGIIVDKSILPLDSMKENCLYVYESIFSGTVLGLYTYSKVQPCDFPFVNGKQYHAGSQLRELIPTVTVATGEVAVAPLTLQERDKLYSIRLDQIQIRMLKLYEKYKEYGYPFTIIPQLIAASDEILTILNQAKHYKKKYVLN
jgi:hypothetical protein